jgi:hypothetical protein
MMCDHAKELIAASWLRELNAPDEAGLKQHLTGCAECSAEMTALTAMWDRLGDLPSPEPSRALDVRFEATLQSLIAESAPKPAARQWKLADLWPRNFVWQIAIAAACLVIGLGTGLLMPHRDNEIRQLRKEITATREMVALSLMQQGSATQRLRGVDYSGQMPRLEPEIISALIEAVNHDSSVNVRLAAIDALGKAAGSGGVVLSLARSLPKQDSPMVQAALIDYLVDARDHQAVPAIQQFEKQPNLDPAVVERAHTAVQELSRF